MKKNKKIPIIGLLFSLILFLIFICSAISVVILIFRAPNIIRKPIMIMILKKRKL